MNTYNAVEVIKTLRKAYTLEELAVKMGFSFMTLWAWSKGKRLCAKNDYDALLRLTKEIKK